MQMNDDFSLRCGLPLLACEARREKKERASETFDLSHTGFTALDIETTGLSPQFCGIVEIAALKVLPDRRSAAVQTPVDPR